MKHKHVNPMGVTSGVCTSAGGGGYSTGWLQFVGVISGGLFSAHPLRSLCVVYCRLLHVSRCHTTLSFELLATVNGLLFVGSMSYNCSITRHRPVVTLKKKCLYYLPKLP